MSSETPGEGASDEQFDFVRECIDTYKAAKNAEDTDARIKALALIQKVQLPKSPVKEDGTPERNLSTVEAAQERLRKPK